MADLSCENKKDDKWERAEVNPLIREEFRPLSRLEKEKKERFLAIVIFWGGFLLYTILAVFLFIKLWNEDHPVILTIVSVVFVLLLFGKYMYNEIKNNRPAGFASKDAIGRNIREVVGRLEENGFTSLKTLGLNDLSPSEKDSENTVVTVTINGESTFSETKKFSYKSKIIITHHSMKKTHSPIASSGIGEWNYSDLAAKFTDAGFVNVKTVAGEDLNAVKNLISKPDMVYRVFINETEKFSEESVFPIDAEVEIVYHSFKEKDV